MSSKVDENENETERQELQTEITELLAEIERLKGVMFKMYEANKDNKAFAALNESLKNKALRPLKKRKITRPDKLEKNFFTKFLKVFLRPKLTAIRFSFPRADKEQFGLQLRSIKPGQYYLEKCYLPHTFNMQDQKQNLYPVAFHEVPRYIQIIMENINAYSLRERQIDEFKSVIDKRVTLNHSKCFTEVDLSFKILTQDSSARKNVSVNLFYPLLHIVPTSVEVTVEGDVLLKRYLEAIFAVFKEDTLVKAYQQAFVNSDQLKFFV